MTTEHADAAGVIRNREVVRRSCGQSRWRAGRLPAIVELVELIGSPNTFRADFGSSRFQCSNFDFNDVRHSTWGK